MKRRRMRLNKTYHIEAYSICFILFLLLFENPLEIYIPILGKIDEIVFIGVFIIAIIRSITNMKIRIDSKSKRIIFAVFIIGLIGITGNVIYRYQYLKYAIKDVVTFKGIITFAIIPIVFYGLNLEKYKDKLNRMIQVISISLFILLIVNLIFDIFPYYEIKLGIKAQKLFFSHPTYLVSTGVMIIALLSAFLKEHKENLIFIAMTSLIVLFTLRTKAIVFLIVLIYLTYVILYKQRKLNKRDILLISIIAIFFMAGKTIEYIQNPDWARSALTINSFKVATDHIPIGSGFGTYGSWRSALNYSPLYYNYGMECLWGTAPDSFMFIADSFWPMILGQFGFIGVILMLYIVIMIYLSIKRNRNIYCYFGQLVVLGYLISASVAEPTFTGPYAVMAFFTIRLLDTKSNYSNRRNISYYNIFN